MIIRAIKSDEYGASQQLVERVFATAEHSDDEHLLIDRLRHEEQYIQGFDIVAVEQEQIIGHVMLSTIKIGDYEQALCLAPLAVSNEYQHQGIGGQLIKYAEQKARELQFMAIHIIGFPEYYGKFGYQPASNFGITVSYPIDDQYVMIKELETASLNHVQGIIEYQKSFGI